MKFSDKNYVNKVILKNVSLLRKIVKFIEILDDIQKSTNFHEIFVNTLKIHGKHFIKFLRIQLL